MDNSNHSNNSFNEAETINAFMNIPYGEPIPEEGPCFFFYSYINAGGETFIINAGEKFEMFNVNHDHIISTLDFDKYTWDISINGETIVLTLILKWEDDFETLNFKFSRNNYNSTRMLNLIKEKKEITIHFLNLLYGQLIKEKSNTFRLPDEILNQMNF